MTKEESCKDKTNTASIGLIQNEATLSASEKSKTYGIAKISAPEAAKLFFNLADKYYESNFGTFPKAEIDQFMFEAFFDSISAHDNSESDTDNGNGWQYISDLQIAQQLGVLPNRVSNLRTKMDIRKNQVDDKSWIDTFLGIIQCSQPYIENDCLKFLLPDKYSKAVIEDALMQGGYFHDYTFNPKALVLPMKIAFSLTIECSYKAEDPNGTPGEFVDAAFKSISNIDDQSVREEFEKRYKELRSSGTFQAVSDVLFSIAKTAGAIGSLTGFIPNISPALNEAKALVTNCKELFAQFGNGDAS